MQNPVKTLLFAIGFCAVMATGTANAGCECFADVAGNRLKNDFNDSALVVDAVIVSKKSRAKKVYGSDWDGYTLRVFNAWKKAPPKNLVVYLPKPYSDPCAFGLPVGTRMYLFLNNYDGYFETDTAGCNSNAKAPAMTMALKLDGMGKRTLKTKESAIED